MSRPMTSVDSFWLHMDHPTNLMVISALLEFNTPVSRSELISVLEKRLLVFPRFRQKVAAPMSKMGQPVWEDDPFFDIRAHVRRVALPRPGGKAELMEMISDLMADPLDDSKPLWQFHLIENAGPGSVIFARIHHCIADGIALIHVLLSLADASPDAPESRETRPERQDDALSFVGGAVGRMARLKKKAVEMSGAAVKLTRNMAKDPKKTMGRLRPMADLAAEAGLVLGRLLFMLPDPKTAFKGKLGVRKKAVWSDPVSLKDIKTIGKAYGATVNDVLVANVTGALRHYLQQKDNRVSGLEIRVMMPVNIRRPGTETELGNRFSLVVLPLPVHVKDRFLRLREIKRRLDHLKRSPDAYVGFQALNAIGVSPSAMAKKAAVFFANKATAVLTNVPGPGQPLYLAGNRIENMMFWVPRTGRLGLGISIISYNGQVRLGLAADAGLIEDPEVILEGFSKEFQEFLELIKAGKTDTTPLVINDRSPAGPAQKGTVSDGADRHPEDPAQGPGPDFSREDPALCRARTRTGAPCKNRAVAGSAFCHRHQPD